VAQEREAKLGVAADAMQAVFGDRGNLTDCVGAQVCELRGLEIPKDLFGGIELRRVAREALYAEP
jgi:hypothetical protein